MKKALVVASVGGFIEFEKNNIKRLESLGYEVHVACSTYGWEKHLVNINQEIIDIPFNRRPLSKENIKAYKKIRELIRKGGYQLIHCHTPVAGVITRLAAKRNRKNSKVVYTAHGFHFFQGSSILNWLIYFPVEWYCSWFTDVLITINTEDYKLAKKKFHAKDICYVPGIGIDIEEIRNRETDRGAVRRSLGLENGQKFVLSVGELNENKNHEIVIKAIAKIGDKNLQYFIAGEGNLRKELIELAEILDVKEQIHLLGYRNDIIDLNKSADLFCLPSHREGLSVALMEAIACGIPIICSDIRGNRDLAEGNGNITLFNESDVDDCVRAIQKASDYKKIMGAAIQKFSIVSVGQKMDNIYKKLI